MSFTIGDMLVRGRRSFLDLRQKRNQAPSLRQRTRYIVYGAGAVGGVIAAKLFQQGDDVVVVARGEHLAAIQRSGLTLESPLGSVTLPLRAVEHPSEITFQLSTDIVLFATKTQDSASALDDLLRVAGPEIPVLCLQNGVAGARMALRRFEKVGAAMMILPGLHLKAGVVQTFSAPVCGVIDVGLFPAGVTPSLNAVVGDLRRAGFHSEIHRDICRWQYGKLLVNLKNVLQALCGPDANYGDIAAKLREEAVSCYRAAGIAYASEAEVFGRARDLTNIGRPGDSSWQSLARGTGTIETDFLNGEIALLGRLHGVPTPFNTRLQHLAHRFARERRAPGSLTVDELRQLLRTPHANLLESQALVRS